MTHERCSELLAGYVRGELPRDAAEDVQAHLAECAECRAEQRAVAVLAAGVDSSPMDDVERARLHRGLAQELFAARANEDLAGTGVAPPRWARWLAPAAAAAVIAAGVFVVTSGGGDDAGIPASVDAPVEDREDDGVEEFSGGGGHAADAAPAAEPDRSRALGATAEGFSAADAGPQPHFDPRLDATTAGEMADLGRSGDPFRRFAGAYEPSEGAELYDGFLDVLAEESIGAGPEIEECAATLPQDGTLVPAYGALTQYEGSPALVLGFVTSDPGSGALDRYLIWVWERGSCEQPIDTLFGEIARP